MLYANDIPVDQVKICGGETEFEIGTERIMQIPEPNLAILFPSRLLHRGRAFNRFITNMRVTIAWKLRR